MITLGKLTGPLLAIVAFVILGCGGNSIAGQDPVPLGEGNIPIGRAGNPDLGECRVLLFLSDGTQRETASRNGVVYVNKLPLGPTSISLYPKDPDFAPETIVFIAGVDQRYQFNSRPFKRSAAMNVKEVICSIKDGAVLQVGRIYDLKVMAIGRGQEFFRPSVALSNGFGSLDREDRLTPTVPGPGQIIIKAMGYTATIDVTVESNVIGN